MQQTRHKTASLPAILLCLGIGLALVTAALAGLIDSILRDGAQGANWFALFYGLLLPGALVVVGVQQLRRWREFTPAYLRRQWWRIIGEGAYLTVALGGCAFGIIHAFTGTPTGYAVGAASLVGGVLIVRAWARLADRARSLDRSVY